MSRPHVDFVRVHDLAETVVGDGLLAGARRRLLSEDTDTGAFTAFVSLPPGFACTLTDSGGSLEVLVLDGEIEISGEQLSALGWARAGLAARLGRLRSERGGELLWMTSGESGGAPRVLDADALPWQVGSHGGPPGIAIKILAEADPVSLLISNVRHYRSGPEFHECPEELYVLAGDVTGRAGTMTAGSYFWRPEYITHGPYRSEEGLLCFVRGHGELYAHWIDDPEATVEQNREYAARWRAGTT